MATVNIQITATVKKLEDFANELGYQEFTQVPQSDGTLSTEPNPINRREYLQEYFKNMTVNELAKVRIRAIEKAVLDQREAEKQSIKDSISGAVAVTFKA